MRAAVPEMEHNMRVRGNVGGGQASGSTARSWVSLMHANGTVSKYTELEEG